MDKDLNKLLVGWLVGTALASSGLVAWSLFIVVLTALSLVWPKDMLFFLLLALGFWRTTLAVPDISYLPPVNRQLVLAGQVASEVTPKTDRQQFNLTIVGFTKPLLVSAPAWPMVRYGQQWTGQGFLIDQRWRKGMAGRPAGFFKGQTRYLADSSLTLSQRFLGRIIAFKNWLLSLAEKLWPEPVSSLVAGMLWGGRASLPAETQRQFQVAGVSHTLAVSGYNVTIVLTALAGILPWLGVGQRYHWPILILGVFLFVLLSGANAAAVRAGLMGVIAVLSKRLGRRLAIGRVLLVTASAMALVNPFVLLYDVGFQLSFLATIGLVYGTPLIAPWLTKVPAVLGLRDNLTSTLAATASTLPLVIYQFGIISLVAPLTNVLILWLIPYAMLFSAAALLIAALWFKVGQIAAIPALLVFKYMALAVAWCSRLPYAFLDLTK